MPALARSSRPCIRSIGGLALRRECTSQAPRLRLLLEPLGEDISARGEALREIETDLRDPLRVSQRRSGHHVGRAGGSPAVNLGEVRIEDPLKMYEPEIAALAGS